MCIQQELLKKYDTTGLGLCLLAVKFAIKYMEVAGGAAPRVPLDKIRIRDIIRM